MRAVEPRRALPPGRRAAARRSTANVDDPGQHRDREEVLEEADRTATARSAGCGSPGRTARRRPRGSSGARTMKPQNVKKCATPGTDHCSSLRCPSTSRHLGPQPRRRPVQTARRRLPRPDQPGQPPRSPPGHRERGHGQQQPEDKPNSHGPSSSHQDASLPAGNFTRAGRPSQPPTSTGLITAYPGHTTASVGQRTASARRSTWSSDGTVGSTTMSVKPMSANWRTRSATCSGVRAAACTTYSAVSPRKP